MAVDRFSTPLYTVAEASHFLGVPDSTFRSWVKGYVRRSDGRADVRGEPIVMVVPGQRVRSASVPFVGLAEGLVLAGIRRAGVPLQRIRPAVQVLRVPEFVPRAALYAPPLVRAIAWSPDDRWIALAGDEPVVHHTAPAMARCAGLQLRFGIIPFERRQAKTEVTVPEKCLVLR